MIWYLLFRPFCIYFCVKEVKRRAKKKKNQCILSVCTVGILHMLNHFTNGMVCFHAYLTACHLQNSNHAIRVLVNPNNIKIFQMEKILILTSIKVKFEIDGKKTVPQCTFIASFVHVSKQFFSSRRDRVSPVSVRSVKLFDAHIHATEERHHRRRRARDITIFICSTWTR